MGRGTFGYYLLKGQPCAAVRRRKATQTTTPTAMTAATIPPMSHQLLIGGDGGVTGGVGVGVGAAGVGVGVGVGAGGALTTNVPVRPSILTE